VRSSGPQESGKHAQAGILGAANGIGKETALRFAQYG